MFEIYVIRNGSNFFNIQVNDHAGKRTGEIVKELLDKFKESDGYEIRLTFFENSGYDQNVDEFLNGEIESFVPQVSDTCQECGCNEFLCGHNKRD